MKKKAMKQILAEQMNEIVILRGEMHAYQRYLMQISNKMDALAGQLNGINNKTVQVKYDE